MKMDDSGQLSLDFLIGFTIFLVAFIIVITMASGLLVSLMSKTVDYDAVAYRTGVILVEDTGVGIDAKVVGPPYMAVITEWETILFTNWEEDIYRAGLAASKDIRKYPNILSEEKIDNFTYLSSHTNDKFIHQKVLFDTPLFQGGASLYSYKFNITLRSIDNGGVLEQIGDSVPPNKSTGYIKRVVKILNQTSQTNIDAYDLTPPGTGIYTIPLNMSDWESMNPLYRPDPLTDGVTISLSNITPDSQAKFSNVSFYRQADPPVLLNSTVPNVTMPAENRIIVELTPVFFTENPVTWGEDYYFVFFFPGDTVVGGSSKYAAYLPAVLEVYIW